MLTAKTNTDTEYVHIGTSTHTIFKLKFAPAPTLLMGITVYVVDGIATVDVPDMTPDTNVKPFGNAGEIVYDDAGTMQLDIDMLDIATFL
jgi:hypothetical protein